MSKTSKELEELRGRVEALEDQVKALTGDTDGKEDDDSQELVHHHRPDDEDEDDGDGGDKADDSPSADGEPSEEEPFTVLQVDGRPLGPAPDGDGEKVRYAWKIVAKNNLKNSCFVDAHVQFVDMDSFVVSEHSIQDFPLAAGLRQKISGQHELSPDDADKVMGVKGWLSRAGTSK